MPGSDDVTAPRRHRCAKVGLRGSTKEDGHIIRVEISGYLGTSDKFDESMGNFAIAYADQTERDHAALKVAVRAGVIAVELEE
jgi:hypothetical protein